MKKSIVLFCMLAFIISIHAQSLQSGKQNFYYQRYSSAEKQFHGYLRQNPSDAEGWLWLVKSYLRQNKASQARDSFFVAPAGIADDPYGLVTKGVLLLNSQKKDSARTWF